MRSHQKDEPRAESRTPLDHDITDPTWKPESATIRVSSHAIIRFRERAHDRAQFVDAPDAVVRSRILERILCARCLSPLYALIFSGCSRILRLPGEDPKYCYSAPDLVFVLTHGFGAWTCRTILSVRPGHRAALQHWRIPNVAS